MQQLLPALGVVASSLIAGLVAFVVAAMKSKWDRESFQRQLDVQLDEHRQSVESGRTGRKLDIAYKYAELNQNNPEMAQIFLREVAKETAIGFLYHDENDKKSKIWIRNDANILIGRSATCDVVLENTYVSREHCIIHTRDDLAYVIPLNPTNPVLIDGEPVRRRTRLAAGARMKIGTVEFQFFDFG